MVFPSVPLYLDPPNWSQASGAAAAPQFVQQVAAPPADPGMPGQTAAARPMSMAERARLAKVPQPEPALKCPRCESTNTKFCYFNNYSLTQPRHFCKTCRRYWTRGGALRNVPVGGGCRRNRRSKSSASRSGSTPASDCHSGASSSSSSTTSNGISHGFALPPQPFITSLHPLAEYPPPSSMGLGFGGIHSLDAIDYPIGSGGLEQWRLPQFQHFPFLGGMDQEHLPASAPVTGSLYPFDNQDGSHVDIAADYLTGQLQLKASSSGLNSQMAAVKLEDTPSALGAVRQNMGITGTDYFWGIGGGNRGSGAGGGGGVGSSSAWSSDLSGFSSSALGNIL